MSSRRQGVLTRLRLPAALVRRALNLWPPFAAAGIRVTRLTCDYREADVALRLRLTNRNYFGTQFGGSLYAMTDPFFALMMLNNLGPGYVVWDKAGSIRYLRPGRGDVFARFRLPAAAVARTVKATERGAKHEPTFRVAIVDAEGTSVAEVEKTLHIRRRRASDAPEPDEPTARAKRGKAGATAPAARPRSRARSGGTAAGGKPARRTRTANA